MESKKNKNIFKKIMMILFLTFAVLMIVLQSGYYEAKQRSEIVLTEEKLKEYQEKIANNEEIDLDAYYQSDSKYYGNKMSELGTNMTYKLEKVMVNCFDVMSDVFKILF